MSIIALPKKIDYQKNKNENEGTIIVEPLFPGYGITLGNALRRVLLSSLSGAAPVAVRIKGAEHEFATLPNVKEDILEIILNLKKLRLKVFSEEPVVLSIEEHGKKTVKASDIKKNSEVEIIKQDLEIATITDVSGSLSMEIIVNQGMGYETIEGREAFRTGEKKEKEIGYIEMDSIYSPILSAGIKIENVRVGKMTNWDKLVIDIRTDGTISPEDAFKRSVEILVEQFNALGGKEEVDKEKENSKSEETGDNQEKTEKEPAKEKPEDEDKDKKTEEEETEAPKRKRGRPKKVN